MSEQRKFIVIVSPIRRTCQGIRLSEQRRFIVSGPQEMAKSYSVCNIATRLEHRFHIGAALLIHHQPPAIEMGEDRCMDVSRLQSQHHQIGPYNPSCIEEPMWSHLAGGNWVNDGAGDE